MPSYDSRPPLRRTIPVATKRYGIGRPCPRCQTVKPATAHPGLCRHCLDARDNAKTNQDDVSE